MLRSDPDAVCVGTINIRSITDGAAHPSSAAAGGGARAESRTRRSTAVAARATRLASAAVATGARTPRSTAR